jgi:cysteine-rich repeat protein
MMNTNYRLSGIFALLLLGLAVPACNGSSPSVSCGNGIPEEGEACDDGNRTATDDCTNECTVARCGDSIVHEGVEECDDGNSIDDDNCTNDCAIRLCGDGIEQPGEECEDGNATNEDGCLNTCMRARCGDG